MNLESFPQFPNSRQVTLEDESIVTKIFSEFPTEISERTFGSIFAWRHFEHRADLSHLDDHLVISWFKPKYGRVLLPPVGPEPDGLLESLASQDMRAKHDFIGAFGMLATDATKLRSRGMICESLRDEWDYVYRTIDLIRLEGPKYHTERKELKKVISEHELVFQPMSREHQQACLELQETWCDLKHCSLDKLSKAEDLALREAIAHLDVLGLFGGVVLERGKVQALTIGERLNDRTAVVHFEKANPAIRGLYQFVNQQFCERLLGDFEFVNREQDVGEPGLRRAKLGYHPHHFVEKHVSLFG